MTRTYPAEPRFADPVGAERAVWEALAAQLPDDAALVHGIGLQEGSAEREIDILVVWPGHGLAVIEVKGGQVRRDANGWHQGTAPHVHRIDPVVQARDARHTLTRLLGRRRVDAARARTVHLIALPHVVVPPDADLPDLPRAMLMDRGDLDRAAGAVAVALREHGAGTTNLPPADVEPLLDVVAGSFPAQSDLLVEATMHEDHLDALTRDQARLVRVLDAVPRVQVVGGAGTGKTWLALDLARRRAAAGDRVALMCYSRGLGRYLERTTATWPARERPAFVGLFHDLPLAWGAAPGDDDDSDYWERRLPLALADLAAARPRAELFDSIVVDEAQDFGAQWWTAVLACLRDPGAGRLAVFSDDGQKVFDRDGVAPVELAPVQLDENLRSTQQIAQLCGSLHDGVTRPRGWPGAPVTLADVPFERAVAVADDAVDLLLDAGYAPGQVALLTTGRRHEQQRSVVEAGGWAAYWDEFFAGESVFYGHVLGFKGLERTAVVLAVNGFRDAERARSLLYTGLSRARVRLVVLGPRAAMEALGGEAVRRRLAEAEVWVPPADDDPPR
jgi:hypothetical protein